MGVIKTLSRQIKKPFLAHFISFIFSEKKGFEDIWKMKKLKLGSFGKNFIHSDDFWALLALLVETSAGFHDVVDVDVVVGVAVDGGVTFLDGFRCHEWYLDKK